MAEPKQSKKSKPTSLAEISFEDIASDKGPTVPPTKKFDPRILAEHFAPLLPDRPSPEVRRKEKESFAPFPGL